jgi:hypothetical protein
MVNPKLLEAHTCRSVAAAAILWGATQVAGAADPAAVIAKGGTFACTSWAAWHDFTEASLMPAGASYGKDCPIRLKGGMKVEIVEEDAGAGASVVRARGRE